MFQLFNFTMLLALLTNNMGILWVAMEARNADHRAAGIALPHGRTSLEAAWKYFILCGVGIAQALFGTILLYFAAEKLLGVEGGALLWTELNNVKSQLEPTVLSLAFVFLLVGYGTKVGLVPLHNWPARRACGGPDAGFGGALGPAAQCCAVCGRALPRFWSRLAADLVCQRN